MFDAYILTSVEDLMSRVNAFFLLLFAFSSICFGASLMHMAMPELGFVGESSSGDQSEICLQEANCQRLMHANSPKTDIVKELYNNAFILSLDGRYLEAKDISECAAHLALGVHNWKIDAKTMLFN
jgi:hypothetical protein